MSDKPQSEVSQPSAMAQALQAAAASAPDSALTSQIAAAAPVEPPADDVNREPVDGDKGDVTDKPAETVGEDGLTDAQRSANAATLAKVNATRTGNTTGTATATDKPAADASKETPTPAEALKDTPKTAAEAAPVAAAGTEASSVKINGGQPLDQATQEAIDNNPNNEAPETPAAIADAGVAGTNLNDTSDEPGDHPDDVEPVPAEGDAPVAEVPQAIAPVPKGLVRPASSVHADTQLGYQQPEWFNDLSPQAQALKQAFDAYMHNMRPKLPVTDETVARQQATLHRIFVQTINTLEHEDFQTVFTYILNKFHEHKDGVFYPTRLNRGAEVINLDPNERRLFQRLCNMLGLLADPNGRANALKQVDLNKTLTGTISEPGRQKVFQYFNV